MTESDRIAGDDGNDKLHGGDGDDTIVGGPGNDTLFGGDGADEFWFSVGDFANNGKNHIKDFDPATDKIVIFDPDLQVDGFDPLDVTYRNNKTIIDLNANLAGASQVIVHGVDLDTIEYDLDIVTDDMPVL